MDDRCIGDDGNDKDVGRDRLPLNLERSVPFPRIEAGTLADGRRLRPLGLVSRSERI
jgi:hypothetical protein